MRGQQPDEKEKTLHPRIDLPVLLHPDAMRTLQALGKCVMNASDGSLPLDSPSMAELALGAGGAVTIPRRIDGANAQDAE